MPRISVIVDNYNYARWLPEALDSVQGQTFRDYECIVVDDGSTDGSREIIENHARHFPALVPVFKENGGQTSAFNAGFAVSSGEIIAFLDSDDYWYPDKLERIAAAHQRGPLVQHYLAPNGEGVYRKVSAGVNRHEALVRFGFMYNHSPTSGLSFARELLEPFFPLLHAEEMRGYADGCLLMIALTQADVTLLEDVLGYYRIHDRNLNAGRTDAGEAARRVVAEQRAFVNKQLTARGRAPVPFDDHAWYRHLLGICRERQIITTQDSIAIYGTEAAGLRMTSVLREMGVPIWGYADSNAAKWNTVFEGKTVAAPSALPAARNEFSKVLIASSAVDAIRGTLRALGFSDDAIIALPL